MAEHLDHLHYLNDILLLRIDDLNYVLSDHLLNRLLIPLYIFSLICATPQDSSTMNRLRISQTVSLFLLSQVFLIVSYKPLLLKLVDILLKSNKTIFELPEFVAPIETLEESLIQAVKAHNSDENESEINEHSMTSINDNNISQSLVENSDQITEPLNDSDLNSVEISMDTTSLTDEEKAKVTLNRSLFKANLTENKPFLESILSALDCDNQTDDRLPLFTLCLLYAVIHNSGIVLGLTELYQTITLSLRINNSIFSIRRK